MHQMVKQQRHVCTLLKLKGVVGLGRYQKVDARPCEVVEESDPQSNKKEQRVSNVAESGLPLALFWQAPTEAQEGPMLVLPLVCSFCAAWVPFSALLASFWTLQMLPFVPLGHLLGTYWHYFGRPQRKHKKDPCLCFRWWAHFVPLGLHSRLYIP